MFWKFNKSLKEDIDYIIGFDLALYNTGVSIYDVKKAKMIDAFMICVNKNEAQPAVSLYGELLKALNKILLTYGLKNFMIIQESLPQQAGKFTTVATLQGLAKAHGMLELAIYNMTDNFHLYDEKGIHSVSVKAVFKSEINDKPSKKDIKKVVCEKYGYKESDLTDDQSDSMALIYTLLERKWNNDIEQKIKEIKKEIKTLKMEYAIKTKEEEINKLLKLKI